MPKRHKQQQTNSPKAPGSTKDSQREETNHASSERREGDQEGSPGGQGQGRPVGLRRFVDDLQGKQYRVVEMRIILVCSLGVFAKVLFSDIIAESEEEFSAVTYAILTFAALCVLMVIFNTWLDYFPSRLTDVEPREAEGQGIPLACLLLPMVCCAVLYCSLYYAKHLTGLLAIYLIVLCVCGLCSIVATLLHSIPHPTNITVYNFAVIGISLAVQNWLGVSLWIILPALSLYSAVVPWLIYTFPRSFTFGEAMIISQGVTVMIGDTLLQLFKLFGFVSLPPEMDVFRSESVLYVELLLTGVIMCCLLLSPALYKVSSAKHFFERKFWSGTFILLSLSIGFMLVLPWLGELLGGYHPIPLVLTIMFSNPVRIALVSYWFMVSVAAGVVLTAQSSNGAWAVPLKAKKPSSLWMRKWFHLFGLLVFLPGVALDPAFISFAASLTIFLFCVAELCRFFRLWPFGETIHQLLRPMLDTRDSGSLVVSHLYLFLGFSLPLWLCPVRDYYSATKLSMYSGVLALGIGDAVAAVSGKLMGKVKWPGTKKTFEGTLMSVLTQLLGVLLIVLIDPHLSFFSGGQWAIVVGSIVITAAMEAYTWQVDNLILGLFQFGLLVAFLH